MSAISPARRVTSGQLPVVVVAAKGEIPDHAVEYARTKVLAVIGRYAPEPVLYARVRLARAADPAVPRPALAQASLDVNGRMVRAQVAAETLRAATDLLHDRLREQLSRIGRDWESRRGAAPGRSTAQRHPRERPASRPGYQPRPAEQRELVRHKSVTPAAQTPDEAACDMETMDYDFYLFADAETGQDSVLYLSGDVLRMARLDPAGDPDVAAAGHLTGSPLPAPRLTTAEATGRLELTGQRFVFFADHNTGRGSVLYHRYDGHYGLITLASE